MAAKKKPVKAQAGAKAEAKSPGTGKGKTENGLPLHLVALLIVGALAFGYMVRLVTQPQQGLEVVPGFGSTQPKPSESQGPIRSVDVILLYSSKCAICSDSHTMLEFLDEKGIKYDLELYSAESERGKQVTAEYNVKEVPIILVKSEDIRQHKEVRDNFERFFDQKGDRYLVVEPDLDKATHPKYFLQPNDESCLVEQKPRVFVFDDPYCPTCVMNRINLNEARKKFGDQVEFIYSYIPTDSRKLVDQYGAEEAERAARYLACSQLQGKINELDQQLVNKLCDITNDGVATVPEMYACQSSSKLGQPLSKEELDKLAQKAGLDMNLLEECAPTAKSEFDKSFSRSLAYNVRSTPLAVVDCKYVVHVADLEQGVCEVLPDHPACKDLRQGEG